MLKHAGRRRSAWRLMSLLLLLGVVLGAHAGPSSLKLPGRKPDSTEPWGFFLGRAAHIVISRQYLLQYPTHGVFIDPTNLLDIVKAGKLGEPERLSRFVRFLRPDITDTRALALFEIKPDNEQGRQEGRVQAERYLAALNEAVDPDKKLVGGTGFEGSLFIEFENGGVLWQLSWRTPEPGVTLYRWSRRREKPRTSWQERAAQKEEELSPEDIEQRGELAEQAIRAAYGGSGWPRGFEGHVYLPVDCQ